MLILLRQLRQWDSRFVSFSLCLFAPCHLLSFQGRCLNVSLSLLSFCLERRQRKACFSQRLPVLLSRASIGLRNISCERPHAALVRLHHVIAASIEADGFVVHVDPPAPQFPFALLGGQPSHGVPLVVFDPHTAAGEIAKSYRVIRLTDHVLNVAVKPHVGVEEYGYRRPGTARKPALEEVVHGNTCRPRACCIGDSTHPAVTKHPQRGIFVEGTRAHRSGSPLVLPLRRPQVQQPRQIGFGGLLRDLAPRQVHF